MTSNRVIVIFGATGDLAQRMLFPSLYFLDSEGLLPPDLMRKAVLEDFVPSQK